MNAEPLLARIARALTEVQLEAILIGNAAAALHGAPVTTLDFDFFYRRTPRNVSKVKRFARGLGAAVFQPFYPVSNLLRVITDDSALQVDFLGAIHGLRSFEGVRSRAAVARIGGTDLVVASLQDVVASKRAAGRPKDLAVLPILTATLEERAHEDERRWTPQASPTERPRARARGPSRRK